jgi:hypothetical protein
VPPPSGVGRRAAPHGFTYTFPAQAWPEAKPEVTTDGP